MSVFEINPNVFRPNLVSKFSEILEDEKKATNLEKAIYNYTIKEASTRRLVKKWENPWFMHLYCDRLRTIYFNLKNEEILNLFIVNGIDFAKWLQDNYSTNDKQGSNKPLPKGYWRKDFTDDVYKIETVWDEYHYR